MTTLIGIIFFHLLVIVRTKISGNDRIPYFSIAFLTLMMVAYVVYMMFTTEAPER